MQRSFLRPFLVCLIPVLASMAVVIAAFVKYQNGAGGFKLGVDLVGGTILVYEVDAERMQQQNASATDGARSNFEINELVDSLKRRIDPVSQKNITIRPVGDTRVEIILPYGAGTDPSKKATTSSDVQAVQDLISQAGRMEFRILANQNDDQPIISALREYYANAKTDPVKSSRLEFLALNGLAPVVPPGNYNVFGDPEDFVNYAWVELSLDERDQLKLSNKYETPAEGMDNSFWKELEAARKTGDIVVKSNPTNDGTSSAVYFSRPCISKRYKEDERAKMKYEYFVLTRVTRYKPDNVTREGSINSLVIGERNVSMTAFPSQDSQLRPAVGFRLSGDGPRMFGEMTERNRPSGAATSATVRNLAIVLDDKIISAPNLQAVISDSGIISGSFTQDDVTYMVRLLKSGALPAILKAQPVSVSTIGPTLGADTIRSGTTAVVAAFAAVLLFMVWYYRFAGFVASVALFANLLLTVAFMVAVNATFTLPGLAGLVLTLGMAVDANVLIYERVREELDRGANLLTAIRNGYDRAFPTIIDTHLSSIFTAIVLYSVGNDTLKGFGISLTVGLVISLFTSLYITRTMFDYWMVKTRPTTLKMKRMLSKQNIDFMSLRKVFFPTTVVLTVLGIGLFLWRGQAGLNIDFLGGTAYGGRLEKPIEISELRKLVTETAMAARLKVESVKPTDDPLKYTIAFANADAATPTVTVQLANNPLPKQPDATPEARAEAVKARVSQLPDVSVEQLFLSSDTASSGSRYFTLRTTEREASLVQVMLDRLFRDAENKPLLDMTLLESWKQEKADYILTFNSHISSSYIRSLLDRQFPGTSAERTQIPFELEGIADDNPANADERYKTMKLIPLAVPVDGARTAHLVGPVFGVPFSLQTGPLSVPARMLAIQGLPDPSTMPEILSKVKTQLAQSPQPERLDVFDGVLAQETQSRAIYAILASWVAILMYLWFRFGSWTFGLAAVLCLIHDLALTLGIIAACHYLFDTPIGWLFQLQDFKINLDTVAALLTLVGYSVNDTIVVFDRIREVRGKNPMLTPAIINQSVNQTLSRTILASLTTWLVVVVLYLFGGEGVHLFSFVMVVGVLIGTYSSIYVASPLLLWLGEGQPAKPAAPPVPVKAPAKAAPSKDGDASK
ncbi:protein translocase subunit SecD [Tuwongella immobilis]|uniref:Multifunctional fusion protein n=1 Tax=Tuwongella immobilis TaxID=692036 RepID=A0A6C2YL57_9BACT|nr:protein translocase subunit SecD [Tuwongella immobilis]VIP02107.1 protein-export membrane protein secd : Protein-export membrane protein secD OS=Planctomyces maris DSM 8797 GN=PM8797T_31765 PE=3 SV=1: SecD_SecF: SecD_SecF [Tuwongella immobilis]VTS00407.1 protein-export membrane protein secd : Protein-export membrane protein secD OS=Planctomyces maris DSM 8797 GN=PM8797T_31765 PE=3 SV=1: SecD_SecF: SecD_SecF [Tuwongella immobilis]